MGSCVNSNNQEYRHDPVNGEEKYGIDTKGTRTNDRAINQWMRDVESKDTLVIKLLLLGAGSSGKSTLFRQIECIHGQTADENPAVDDVNRFFVNIDSMKRTIRLNCIHGLIKLLKQSMRMANPPCNIVECKVDFSNPTIEKAITHVLQFAQHNVDYKQEQDFNDAEQLQTLGDNMHMLWNLESIQHTFQNRQHFSLIENLDYFLGKISEVMDERESSRYWPSVEDILNSRMQTTGIVERTYMIQKRQFILYDVGGQRNERRKWIQVFDTVNGLIFVAALNHYCCVLFEDENMNAMQESLQLFDETCNSKWFTSRHTQFILFLNKDDLFKLRLREDKIPLSVCFGKQYTGPNYDDDGNLELLKDKERDAWFEKCYHESVEFVRSQYLKRNRNDRITTIFSHIITATERSNIQRVFDDVRIGIISQTLVSSGFTHLDGRD